MIINKKPFPLTAMETAFAPGMVDADYARATLITALHGHLPKCPRCETPITNRQYNKFAQMNPIRCKKCGFAFNPYTGTIFSGTKIPLRDLFLMLLGFHLNLPLRLIAHHTGIPYRTVAWWKNKIKDET